MASSVIIFSTRAISWIWKRIVSRFSNTKVTTGPTRIRRRFLSSMIVAAELVALALVGAQVDDVVEGQLRPWGGLRWSVRQGTATGPRGRWPVPGVAASRRRSGWSSTEFSRPCGEAAGVALLGPGQRLEPLGDLVEALVAGGLGEAGVHLGVLVGLAGDGRLEVVVGGADGLAGGGVADLGEEVEVAEGVAGLALGDRAEEGGDVGVALDVGLLGEVEVAAVRLALAGERLLEVLVGLAALEVRHGVVVLLGLGSGGMLAMAGAVGSAAGRGCELGAPTPEDDLGAVDRKPWSWRAGGPDVGDRLDVDDRPQRCTRGGGAVDVGIEAGRAGAEVDRGSRPWRPGR